LQAAPARAVERGATITTAPFAGAHRQPLWASGRSLGHRFIATAGAGRSVVPGADLLADVAAEDVRAEGVLDRIGQRAPVLDRPKSQATAGVEDSGGKQRARGARLQAGHAGAALLGNRLVGRQVEVGHDLGQQYVRPEIRVDETAILADPAEPRRGGKGPLEQGCRVHTDAVAERGRDSVGRATRHAVGAHTQCAVIVGAPRIPCDLGAVGRPVRLGRVGGGKTDDGTGSGKDPGGIGAGIARVGEVAHPGMPAGRQPLREAAELGGLARSGDGRSGKSAPPGLFAKNVRREPAIVPEGRSLRDTHSSDASIRARPMADEKGIYPRIFGVVVAAALAYALFLILRPFAGAILWALLLCFLLFPVNRLLRNRLAGRAGVAAAVLTVAVVLGIVVPAAMLASAFVHQGSDLLARLSAMASEYKIARPSDLFQIPIVEGVLRFVQERTPVTADQIREWIVGSLRGSVQFLLTGSRAFFLGALGMVVSLALMLFLLYFFFRDGDQFAERIVRLIPVEEQRKKRLMDYLAAVTRAVVLGSVLTALAQGAMIGLGFWIAGLPSPVVFGVLAAVCALLPVGGTAFVWIPGALVLVAQGRWGWGIALAVWGALVVGSADNFLRPLLISGRAQITTLPVFFGVVGGLSAFGMIGMFLGPVVIALALALLRFAEEDRAARAARGDRAS
jgi:predicted PurR-regulated permease PerM